RPRDAFKGGRVETGKLLWNNDDSKYGLGLCYYDICSLYPTVNCHDFYPVSHPEMITCNFDYSLSSYFGLVQCSVLPPRNLIHAVLPIHANGKLIFPLCRLCAENFQIDFCCHSEDERELHGVWVSEELKLAVSEGYKVTKIYCVHNFKRKSKDLFSAYIKTFFKLKMTSSKRPDGETPEQFESFVKELESRDGIFVDKDEFHENPGMRWIAKLCCVSFWGRLGMRESFPKVTLVYSLEKLLKLFFFSSKVVFILSRRVYNTSYRADKKRRKSGTETTSLKKQTIHSGSTDFSPSHLSKQIPSRD
ncbi:MAG: DNA polymerase, partial [Magnetococcus sp. YQC-3]